MQLTDPRPGILLFLLLLTLLSGCRSKQSITQHKETTVSEMHQNGIESTDHLQKNIEIIRTERHEHLSIVPVDGHKTSKVIYRGDTLSFENARIDVGSQQNDIIENDQSVTTSRSRDTTRREFQERVQEKEKDKQIRSSSWGLNLALILGLVVLIVLAYVEIKFNRA